MAGTQITLDTNLLLEYWKDQNDRAVVEVLIALSRSGQVDLAVTARVREDVPRPPLSDRINQLPELNVHEAASVTRLGSWVLGRDMLGDDRFVAVSQQLDEELNRRGRIPPDWRDWDHLHAHFLSRRSAFLTWDERILEIARELLERLGVVVKSPEAWLSERGLACRSIEVQPNSGCTRRRPRDEWTDSK